MCLFPKKILNRSRQFNAEYSPLYFMVPCGRCEECLKNRVNEYLLRADAEFEYNVKLGGDTLFLTLTYNSESIPCTNGIYHFDSSHIRDFFKRLRVNMSRAGFDSTNIRYFLVSEYGGKYKRPHYHALIYFPYKVNSWDFINRHTNLGLFQRSWVYGYVSYSDKHGAYVKSKACNRYCCKYLSKFEDFYFQDGSKDLVKDCPNTKPFHRQSKGFGISMIESLSKWEIINCVKRVITSKGFYLVRLPNYIQRKLFYDYDKDTFLYRLNALGAQIKTNAWYKLRDLINDKVEHIFNKDFREIKPFDVEICERMEVDCLDTLVDNVKDSVKKFTSRFTDSYMFRFFCKSNIMSFDERLQVYLSHLIQSPYLPTSSLTHKIANNLFSQSYSSTNIYQQIKPIFEAYEISRDVNNVITQEVLRDNRKYQETLLNYLS